MISSRGLTSSDPLMEAAPYPAGFPLRQGAGGEQPMQGYSTGRPVKSGYTSFNSSTMAAPYPTGFPLQNPRTSARSRSDHGVIKLERRYLKEYNDPDIEITPAGFPDPNARRKTLEASLPIPVAPTQLPDAYRVAIDQAHTRLRNQPTPEFEEGVTIPGGMAQEHSDRFDMARARIAEAEKEAWRVEQLLREAADVAQASNMARAECEQARRLEQEARVRAQEWPGRARTELAGKKESLGDAKIDLDERVRDLASLERDLEKADFDARAKAHESKIVTKAAKTKRLEADEVERLVAKLDELKREASSAEERASMVVAEVTTCQANVAKRQGALDAGAQQLALSRNAIDQLAQEYAAAVSDAEMCDALVQRELREAQVLAETAEMKRAEALELASNWAELKRGAEEARRRQEMVWQEARAFGDALNKAQEGGLDEHLREPTVASELANGNGQGQSQQQNGQGGYDDQGYGQGQGQDQGYGQGQGQNQGYGQGQGQGYNKGQGQGQDYPQGQGQGQGRPQGQSQGQGYGQGQGQEFQGQNQDAPQRSSGERSSGSPARRSSPNRDSGAT
ncbi:hypothetical protein WJX74_004103 [Apatococcus lobatus]|uniref:Uncharacterized protein n=1 Tax=Apatococcus lobatus TaxID=904363 RepID=A0AAW1S6W2_9CHLO